MSLWSQTLFTAWKQIRWRSDSAGWRNWFSSFNSHVAAVAAWNIQPKLILSPLLTHHSIRSDSGDIFKDSYPVLELHREAELDLMPTEISLTLAKPSGMVVTINYQQSLQLWANCSICRHATTGTKPSKNQLSAGPVSNCVLEAKCRRWECWRVMSGTLAWASIWVMKLSADRRSLARRVSQMSLTSVRISSALGMLSEALQTRGEREKERESWEEAW